MPRVIELSRAAHDAAALTAARVRHLVVTVSAAE
jgi:hypothetical protein